MSKNRSHKKNRGDRKNRSKQIQNELISLIHDSETIPGEVRHNALSKLISLSKRHRLKIPKKVGLMFCKQCEQLYDSTNVRTRIKHGQLIISCLICNDVRRVGGGPKSHRRNTHV